MKRVVFSIFFGLALAALLVLSLRACGRNGTTEEQPVAEFKNVVPNTKFYSLDGEELTFEDFKGKPIVLNLWASWCPPCRDEMPNFEEMYKLYGDDVQFIIMNMQDGNKETPESALYFINNNNYDLPFYFDTDQDIFYNFGAMVLPMTYFISSDLLEIESYTGLISIENLEVKIQELIAEDAELKNSTK